MIYRFKKTFIGVGGREYISNPKLSFPEHVKIRRRGTNPRSGQPYTEAGSAFVETSAVAARLAAGDGLVAAVERGLEFIASAIRNHLRWEQPVRVDALKLW
jgi:hypothetical protein